MFFFTLLSEFFFLSHLVLSWDGDVSAISRDAIEDVRQAKRDTVIDEWDEEFDMGKVRRTLNLPLDIEIQKAGQRSLL